MASTTLDRLRTAMKFSLWTWALYWPGGGLLLIYGGLDPISLAVTAGSLLCFLLLLATGALKADSSRTMKEFMVERPLYLLAGLVVAIVLAAIVPSIEGIALLAFAALWFGGLALTGARVVEHVRAQGKGVFAGKADQTILVLVLMAFFSALVFLDAMLPIVQGDGASLGSPAPLVAICTWMNLLYPPLLLVASRPFREPLDWRMGIGRKKDPMAARRAKPAKDPQPFRAS